MLVNAPLQKLSQFLVSIINHSYINDNCTKTKNGLEVRVKTIEQLQVIELYELLHNANYKLFRFEDETENHFIYYNHHSIVICTNGVVEAITYKTKAEFKAEIAYLNACYGNKKTYIIGNANNDFNKLFKYWLKSKTGEATPEYYANQETIKIRFNDLCKMHDAIELNKTNLLRASRMQSSLRAKEMHSFLYWLTESIK